MELFSCKGFFYWISFCTCICICFILRSSPDISTNPSKDYSLHKSMSQPSPKTSKTNGTMSGSPNSTLRSQSIPSQSSKPDLEDYSSDAVQKSPVKSDREDLTPKPKKSEGHKYKKSNSDSVYSGDLENNDLGGSRTSEGSSNHVNNTDDQQPVVSEQHMKASWFTDRLLDSVPNLCDDKLTRDVDSVIRSNDRL